MSAGGFYKKVSLLATNPYLEEKLKGYAFPFYRLSHIDDVKCKYGEKSVKGLRKLLKEDIGVGK